LPISSGCSEYELPTNTSYYIQHISKNNIEKFKYKQRMHIHRTSDAHKNIYILQQKINKNIRACRILYNFNFGSELEDFYAYKK